jgi:hypothetical protein
LCDVSLAEWTIQVRGSASRFSSTSTRSPPYIVPDEEYRSGLISRGLPEHVADMLLSIFVASRQRRFTLIDPTLARLIGRPPTPLQEVLKAATTGGAG